MALKADREELHTDIRWYMNTAGEPGGLVVADTAGSGGYPGAVPAGKRNVAKYAASPAGQIPIGVLATKVVDADEDNYRHDFYEINRVRKGSKVTIITAGWVTTDMIEGTPVGNEYAYLGANGKFSTTAPTVGEGGQPASPVGRFLTSKDADGFAAVSFNLV